MEQKGYWSRLSIAGINITIEYSYLKTAFFCRNYFTKEEKSGLAISVEESDIEYEKTQSSKFDTIYRNDDYETQAILRKIAEQLTDYDAILMHGAVVAVGNQAYMFSAKSGTGKTTHIKQWIKKANGAYVVNGDKPFIKITDTQAIACGTPWCGKERLGTNTMVPLKAIVFMERSEENHMEEIPFLQAYPYLLRQTHIPSAPEKAEETLELVSKLYGKVSFWRFQCNNFKDDCFDVAFNALVGKEI